MPSFKLTDDQVEEIFLVSTEPSELMKQLSLMMDEKIHAAQTVAGDVLTKMSSDIDALRLLPAALQSRIRITSSMRNRTQHYRRGRRTLFQQNANAGAKIVLRAREPVSSRQKRRAGVEGGSGPWRGSFPCRAPVAQRSGDTARATARIGRRSR